MKDAILTVIMTAVLTVVIAAIIALAAVTVVTIDFTSNPDATAKWC